MEIVAVVVAVLLVVAVVVLALRGGRPGGMSEAKDAEGEPDTRSERFYDGADRPAGPDAETNM